MPYAAAGMALVLQRAADLLSAGGISITAKVFRSEVTRGRLSISKIVHLPAFDGRQLTCC